MSPPQTQSSPLLPHLIGAWEHVSYTATLLTDPTNVIHPLGPNPQGLITYTLDGYMSAQVLSPGQPPFASGNGVPGVSDSSGTQEEWAEVGRRFIAYAGRFWVDEAAETTDGGEAKPMLWHELRVCNLPSMRGLVQKRTVYIEDGQDGARYLNLGIERQEMGDEVREVRVRWRKVADNSGTERPGKRVV